MLIPPTPELAVYGVGPAHLCLAHLIEQADQGLYYEEHYQAQAAKGAYVILDNSAFELGASGYSMGELLVLAKRVGAKEIVFPDAMQDAQRTAKMIGDALVEFAFDDTDALQPMYVPQGQTEREYAECLRFIVRTHTHLFGERPFTVGVSRVYDEVFSLGRYGLLDDYYTQLRAEVPSVEVHLLGWSSIPALARMSRAFPWVRSIDSSKPFAWALADRFLHQLDQDEEEPQRPKDYFNCSLTPDQRKIANYNVQMFQRAAEGNQLPQGVL